MTLSYTVRATSIDAQWEEEGEMGGIYMYEAVRCGGCGTVDSGRVDGGGRI